MQEVNEISELTDMSSLRESTFSARTSAKYVNEPFNWRKSILPKDVRIFAPMMDLVFQLGNLRSKSRGLALTEKQTVLDIGRYLDDGILTSATSVGPVIVRRPNADFSHSRVVAWLKGSSQFCASARG
jgi:hypothetical protein